MKKINPAGQYLIPIVILHIIFMVYALITGHIYLKDSAEYVQQADNIIRYGSRYCGDFNQTYNPALLTQRPPLYGLLIAALTFTGFRETALILLQNILSVLNFWIIFKMLKDYLPTMKWQHYLWTALLFFPSQLIYSNMIMSEMILQTAILLTVYCCYQYILTRKTYYLFLSSICLIASYLDKPVMWLFPFVSAGIILIFISNKKLPVNSFLAALLPLITVLLIVIINFKQTGVPEYSSIQRKLLINYNMVSLLELEYGHTQAIQVVDKIQQNASVLDYPDKARFINQSCLHLIYKFPVAYCWLHLKGVVLFFLDPGLWDIKTFFVGENIGMNTWQIIIYRITGMILFMYHILLSIGFLFFFFLKKNQFKLKWFLILIILYVGMLTGPSASARFMVPVYPLFVLISFMGLYHLLSRLSKKVA